MKRTLLLLLLSVSTLWGQFLPDIPDRLSYAAQLNGSSQYFSKTSPVNMDLNGSELLSDVGFESGRWTAVFNATTSQSTVQKRTGTYSMLVLATGGSATTRSPAVTNATTNKFTGEAWVYVPNTNTSKTVRLSITDQGASVINPLTTVSPATDTWVKVVVNVQAPGTQTGLTLQVGLSGTSVSGDSLYIDDVSLTQAWDGAISVEAKTTSGSTQTLAGTSKSNASRLRIWQNTATASVTLTDGTTSVTATNSATVNDGRFHKWGVTWSKTGNLTLYIDGVAGTGQSITGVGAITVDTLWIGRDQAGNYFNGQLGEKIRVRYSSLPSDIAQWIYRATYERFIPEPPGGGETVLRVFGRRNDALDQSGNQGVLTNTGSTPIIQKQ